jgi:uncharacterized protein YgbK (DUF1537 family)
MKRFLTFYGDDFTGSTDVMEALASHGLRTVLFTRRPSPEEFSPFADCEAIGLAGTSRSQTPAWMDAHLPEAFGWLKSLDARFCHYKVCSTFDSSPEIGNIGRAIEIGLSQFSQSRAALVLGAPEIKRFTFAGHLFAAYQGVLYRIDRHPVMAVHPVTPMDESDVLRHLARQTDAAVELLDVYDPESQSAAGRELLALSEAGQRFVAGSSGVEYALMAATGRQKSTAFAMVGPVERMLVVSGSVSPTTARQIEYAIQHGFTPIAAPALELARGRMEAVLAEARTILQSGGSPLIYSATGPASNQSEAIKGEPNGLETLARSLGRMARLLVDEFRLSRLVIAGGDTSSHALGELDLYALSTRFPLHETPGSPLCLAHSGKAAFNGLEIAMKGGQVGKDDYFVMLKNGIG